MHELLIPVNAKVERAEKHISDFNTAASLFVEAGSYSVTGERDPKTRQPFYYVSEASPVPPRIMVIVGDAIQNLRSALDYLASALVSANRQTPTTVTGFPILKDPKKEELRFLSKVKGMRQEAIDEIIRQKPYRGGDATLWCLHDFSNADKHRFLLAAGAAIHSFNIGQHAKESIPRTMPPEAHQDFKRDLERTISLVDAMPDVWTELPNKIGFPLKKGDKLYVDFPDFQINDNIQFRFFIAFNEQGPAYGQAVTSVLGGFRRRVLDTIAALSPFLG